MRDLSTLKNLEKDALREIANVGAGNAATAVSQLIGTRILVEVPKVSLIRVQDLPEPLGGP
jgi:chemotaxis protein CheC